METQRIDSIIENLYGNELAELLYVYKDDLILSQPRMIFRTDGGAGDRYYYRIEEQESCNNLVFYVSTTTFTKKVLPTSPYLIQWMKEQGTEADKVRDLAADFGTLMHIVLADFLVNGWDFSVTREFVSKYLEKLGHHKNLISPWTIKLNKNIASFAQFCRDYEIEPIAIEIMLGSDEMGIAGTIDLVCWMRTPEMRKSYDKELKIYEKELKAFQDGKSNVEPVQPEYPSKVKGMGDFKSGGVHESAEMQLAINKLIFHENFPEHKLDILFNWAPTDYRTEPTYKYVDQTDTKFDYEALTHFLYIYELLYKNEISEKKVFEFQGVIQNNGEPVSDHAFFTTLAKSLESKLS